MATLVLGVVGAAILGVSTASIGGFIGSTVGSVVDSWIVSSLAPIPSTTCPRESVLPIRLRPDFSVVFEGYAGGTEHWPPRQEARKRSRRADTLRA